MPAPGQAGRRTEEPDWAREIAKRNNGENPRPFLDQPLDALDTAKALIKGMDQLGRINAWLQAERELGRDNGAPRAGVIQLLEARRDYLLDAGQRPTPDTPTDERPDRFQHTTHTRPQKPDWRLNGDPWSEARSSSATVKLAEKQQEGSTA